MSVIQNTIFDYDFYSPDLFQDGLDEELLSTEINYDTFTGIEFGLFPSEPEIAAAPAMLALDVATVANIVAKVAISKQPLDAFDIVTIGLVGVANAGVIAKGLNLL